MLVDVKPVLDGMAQMVNAMNHMPIEVIRDRTGVYETGFNPDFNVPVKEYPLLKSGSSYGVADSIDQILEKYKEDIDDPDNKYVICTGTVISSLQPEDRGWRWSKWGEYIGNYEPTSEYLYEEKDKIPFVIVFQFIQIL